MKKRLGFVSNSSSSSFIITSKNKIKSYNELIPLFKEFNYEKYDSTVKLTPHKLAKYVFDELETLEKIDRYTIKYAYEDLTGKKLNIESDDYIQKQRLYIIDNYEYGDKVIECFDNFDKIYEEYVKHWEYAYDNFDNENEQREYVFNKLPEIRWCYEHEDDYYYVVNKLKNEFFLKYFKKDISELVLYNNIYSFEVSSNGDGWASDECNGIYETSNEQVFIDSNRAGRILKLDN